MPFTAQQYEVRILVWSEAGALARPIREEVFVREQCVPVEEEWDDWDELSDHAIALSPTGQPIGTARLLPGDAPKEVRVGRMAVLRDWRGRGVGATLLMSLLQLARTRGMRSVVLHAQTQAAGFYRRCGFVAEGTEFFEAGIPHFVMRLSLQSRLAGS
jgi:predicted GNAT family N-acyltransferase